MPSITQILQIIILVVGAVGVYYLVSKKKVNLGMGKLLNGVNSASMATDYESKPIVNSVIPERKELNPSDLVPEDVEDNIFDTQMPISKGIKENKNFLQVGQHLGILSEPLRNTNQNLLRAEPAIKNTVVSPWNNSSYVQNLDGQVVC